MPEQPLFSVFVGTRLFRKNILTSRDKIEIDMEMDMKMDIEKARCHALFF